jgi:hypothetical protein
MNPVQPMVSNINAYQQARTSVNQAIAEGYSRPLADGSQVISMIGATTTLAPDGTITIQGSKQGALPRVLKPETELKAEQGDFWSRMKETATKDPTSGPFDNKLLNVVNAVRTAGPQTALNLKYAVTGEKQPTVIDNSLLLNLPAQKSE